MSCKYKMILLYDIPSKTKKEKTVFRKFNTHIKKLGFMMLQHSVYVRTLKTKEEYVSLKNKVLMKELTEGNIRTILLTENKYNEMETICGTLNVVDEILSNDNRIIKL